ncbi:MAG: YcaQ family DNA glycosylase [Alphaproteobacteria bacterium]|nr:YcaQ family DNA glycosylase [Alphaproteobacteria bacterium]
MVEKLSLPAARRCAIAAQGLSRPRPGAASARDVGRIVGALGLLQIDSVNVLTRAHYLPLFSRLGSYDIEGLHRLAYAGRRRRLFEYWGHEASLLPAEAYPLFRWRMEAAARGERIYKGIRDFARRRRALIESVRAQVAARGPLSASEVDAGRRGEGGWWGWSEAKLALEWLFWTGEITTHSRRGAGFERVYDLTERTLPPAVLAAPVPDRAEAQRRLLARAARAHGIATATDLADYFRLPPADVKARVAELVELGELRPAAVEGWRATAYLHRDARVPRRVEARALLAPFDPLVWERDRTERLFGFRYRIEIYTPAPRRVHGYYVLPFLRGDRLVARVDLKADRAAGCLRVPGAFAEPDQATAENAAALGEELSAMARWLGLERVAVGDRGDMARPLADALSRRDPPRSAS